MRLFCIFNPITLLSLKVAISFSVESFVDSPKLIVNVSATKESGLICSCSTLQTGAMKKSDIQKMHVEHLVEEEIVSDEEDVLTSTSVVELKKLELRDEE